MPKRRSLSGRAISNTDEWNAADLDEQMHETEDDAGPGQNQGSAARTTWFKRQQLMVPIMVFVIMVGAVVNWIAFSQDEERLGGSALYGYEQQEHYYVGERSSYTEVSKADWEANRTKSIIALSNLMLAVATFLATGFLHLLLARGSIWAVFSSSPPFAFDALMDTPLMDKIMAVRPDTEPLVEEDLTGHRLLASVSGSWGVVKRRIPKPWFSAEVYSDQIVLSAGKLGTLTLSPYHVTLVEYKGKGDEQGVKITHSSKKIVSPIYIGGVEEDSPFGRALNKVVGSAKVV